jgi:hypothetical protein
MVFSAEGRLLLLHKDLARLHMAFMVRQQRKLLVSGMDGCIIEK